MNRTCRHCGNPLEGVTQRRYCLPECKRAHARPRDRQIRKERTTFGLCVRCGKPAFRGTTYCFEHMQRAAKVQQRAGALNLGCPRNTKCIICDTPLPPAKGQNRLYCSDNCKCKGGRMTFLERTKLVFMNGY